MSKKPEITITVGVVRKVNMGNYETNDVHVSFTETVPKDTMEESYNALMATAKGCADHEEAQMRAQSKNPTSQVKPKAAKAGVSMKVAKKDVPAAKEQLAEEGNPDTFILGDENQGEDDGFGMDEAPTDTDDGFGGNDSESPAEAESEATRDQARAVLIELSRHPKGSVEMGVKILTDHAGVKAATEIADENIDAVMVAGLKSLVQLHIGHSLPLKDVQEIIDNTNTTGSKWADISSITTLKKILSQVKAKSNADPADNGKSEIRNVLIEAALKLSKIKGEDENGEKDDKLGEKICKDLIQSIGGVDKLDDVPSDKVDSLVQAINVEISRQNMLVSKAKKAAKKKAAAKKQAPEAETDTGGLV